MTQNIAPKTQRRPTVWQKILRQPLLQKLATPHHVDTYLQVINPLWSAHEVYGKVLAVQHQTPESVTFRVQTNQNWQGFSAGQYVNLYFNINGINYSRCYSPANIADQSDILEFTVGVHEFGLISKFIQTNLQIGEVLRLSQAQGEFVLPENLPAKIVLISAGSGITPVLSMLRTLCAMGYAGQITFLHYAKNQAKQLYAETLQSLVAQHPNIQYLRGYSDGAGEVQGKFSLETLQHFVPDFGECATFVCGPERLMKTAQEIWQHFRIADQLHVEAFALAKTHFSPEISPNSTQQNQIFFQQSRQTLVDSGETLLLQAEKAGLQPEAGCRMGICHACLCHKVSGQVRDVRDGSLSDDSAGNIQLCVSVPVGNVVLDI